MSHSLASAASRITSGVGTPFHHSGHREAVVLKVFLCRVDNLVRLRTSLLFNAFEVFTGRKARDEPEPDGR